MSTDDHPNRRLDDKRLQELEQLTYATSGEVAGLRTKIDGISGQMDRLEHYIMQSQNRPVNVAAWISAGIAFLGVMALAVGGIMTFVAINAEPLMDRLTKVEIEQAGDRAFRERNIERVTRLEVSKEYLEKEIARIDKYGSSRWLAEDRLNDKSGG